MSSLIAVATGFFELAKGPNAAPVIFGLIVAVVALLIAHGLTWIQFHFRLRDKDRHIEDLVRERDKLQDHVLGSKGQQRLSSKGKR